jgi:hypothetical protein
MDFGISGVEPLGSTTGGLLVELMLGSHSFRQEL